MTTASWTAKASTLLGFLLVSASPAMAVVTDTNRLVTLVGTSIGGAAHMQFSVAPSGPCSFGSVYIDISTDSGKSALSTALIARSTGKILPRIQYNIIGSECYLTLIEM